MAPPVAAQRAAAVRAALDEVREIIGGERTPRARQLAAVAQVLVARLASQPCGREDSGMPNVRAVTV